MAEVWAEQCCAVAEGDGLFRQPCLLKRCGKTFLEQTAFCLENISLYQVLHHCKVQ